MENRRIDVYRNGSDARSLARSRARAALPYARAIELQAAERPLNLNRVKLHFSCVRTTIHNSISIETEDEVFAVMFCIFNCAKFDYNCQKS